jgi:formate dehydrogenase major subunit
MSSRPAAEVQLTIDGGPVSVPAGTTIFDAARINGISIPSLCHQQNENPVGVCRVCVVDVGQRVYAASCIRQCEADMTVKTATGPVQAARNTLVELLMSDHPAPCARQQQSGDCELERLASAAGIKEPRFPRRTTSRGKDDSSPVIAVDHEACILCDRCIRGCDDIRDNWVLARRGKGYQAGIAFDNNLPMSESSCVSCGECMVSCPTGALTNKRVVGTQLGEGDILDPAELLHLPIFQNVSGTFLELNQKAVVKRHFKAGEIVCREGEFGSTAFYILEGQAEVFLASPIAHVKTEGSSKGFFSKLQSMPMPRRRPSQRRVRSPFHSHRRFGRLALRQPYRRTESRRHVRRNDVHELLPAFGDRARTDRLRNAGNAAQRARHPAAQQDFPRATGT